MREGGREWNGFITHIQIHTGTVLSKVRRSEMSAEKCVTILQEVIPFFFRCNSTQFNTIQFTCCPPENKFNSLFLIKKKLGFVVLPCFVLFVYFVYFPSFLSFFLFLYVFVLSFFFSLFINLLPSPFLCVILGFGFCLHGGRVT